MVILDIMANSFITYGCVDPWASDIVGESLRLRNRIVQRHEKMPTEYMINMRKGDGASFPLCLPKTDGVVAVAGVTTTTRSTETIWYTTMS